MAQNKVEIVISAKDEASRALGSISNSVKGMIAVVAGSAAIYGFASLGKSILDTASKFEQFETSLRTLTGSSAKAKEAMSWITDFTAKTPYEIEEVTRAFNKLFAFGQDPTKLMQTLGDTAGALGKSLNDAVEMYTDAVTGEFERLKEFGVRAKSEGDKVTFSWSQNGRDMVITADKTQSGISTALSQIFTRFQGGMEEQSKTWKGQMSNMADNWTLFKLEISQSEGLFNVAKAALKEFSDAIQKLKAEGRLKEWAADIARGVVESFRVMANAALEFGKAVNWAMQLWGSLRLQDKQDELAGLNTQIEKLQKPPGLFAGNWKIPGTDFAARLLTGAGDKLDTANQAEMNRLLEQRSALMKDIADRQGGLADLQITEAKIGDTYKELNEAIGRIQQASTSTEGPVTSLAQAVGTSGAQAGKSAKEIKAAAKALEEFRQAQLAAMRTQADAVQKMQEELYGKPVGGDAGIRAGGIMNDAASRRYEQHVELMKEGMRVYEDTRTPLERYNTELARLNTLLSSGAIDQDTFNRAVAAAKKDLGDMGSAAKEAFTNVGRAVTDVFGQAIRGEIKTTKDLWNAFCESLSNAFARTADAMLSKWFETLASGLFSTGDTGGGGGGWFSTIFSGIASGIGAIFGGGSGGFISPPSVSALNLHGGGDVGPASPRRGMVDAGLFRFAPRLHNGLAPDEFPAILQQGERVIPKNGQQASQPLNVIIQANDAKSFKEMVDRNPGAILGPVLESLRRGGAMRTSMRQHL